MELKVSELTKEDLKELKRHADKVGIEFMASAFDEERVGWLEEIGVKRHKIASRSIFDQKLISTMEKTKKPIIASLGAWKKPFHPKIKNAQFLYCVSEYPAYITKLPEFKFYDGFSDHTIGCYWAREAIKKGAKIIEKHFTLDKTLPGHNQKGSAEPYEFKDLVVYARQHERGIQF
jgi:sialic acid synthase SpsE